MNENEKESPGLIWLCFVNWINTLETYLSTRESHGKLQDSFAKLNDVQI